MSAKRTIRRGTISASMYVADNNGMTMSTANSTRTNKTIRRDEISVNRAIRRGMISVNRTIRRGMISVNRTIRRGNDQCKQIQGRTIKVRCGTISACRYWDRQDAIRSAQTRQQGTVGSVQEGRGTHKTTGPGTVGSVKEGRGTDKTTGPGTVGSVHECGGQTRQQGQAR